METFENTYCKNTEENLKRYEENGWTYIPKLNLNISSLGEGEEYLVARSCLGREVCHTLNKNTGWLVHFREIEDAIKNDDRSVKILSENHGVYIDLDNKITCEKQIPESKVILMLEHILSLQKNMIGGSWINVNEVISEINRFGFYPRPEGKSIDA